MTSRRLLVALLLAGAALHGAYLLALHAHDPLWDLLVHDAHRYHAWASAWAAGRTFESDAFSQAPLYPALAAAVFALAGTRLPAMIVVQLALALGALALVFVAARRAYGLAPAAVAVALGVLAHPLAFYEARLLPTVLAVAVAALAVERLQAARAAATLRAWLAAGAAIGLAGIARPDLLLLLPAAGVLLPAGRRLRAAGALAAGVSLFVAPVALRNLAVSGEPVLVSTQGGITFWQGNNPAARGGFSTPEGFSGSVATQRQEARALAAPALGPGAGDAAVSRYWFRRGLAFLAEDPLRAARLFARKAALALDAREHGLEYAPHLDDSPLRPVLLVSFGVLFALAAVRVVRRPPAMDAERPLLLLLLVETAVLLAFYPAGRYRMTALPALLPLAGFGAVSLAQATRARAAAPFAALAAGALLAWTPLPGRGRDVLAVEDAGALRDRGEAFLTRGDLPRARQALARAGALNPADPYVPLDLGKVEATAGDAARAEGQLRRALTLAPGLAEAHLDLGVLLYTAGRLDEAAAAFEHAHRLAPGDPGAANNLLGTLLRLGRRDAAAALAADMDARGVPIDAALR